MHNSSTMAPDYVFALLFVMTITISTFATREPNNSTEIPFVGASGNETAIIPCEEMNCTEGTCCELGRRICPFAPPCFTMPTKCIPNGHNVTVSNSTESNNTVICSALNTSGNWSGFGGEGSRWSKQGICSANMHSAECGSLCPQDCTQELKCLAITCTKEERCFCNAGYVLLKKNDTNAGCVKQDECPKYMRNG